MASPHGVKEQAPHKGRAALQGRRRGGSRLMRSGLAEPPRGVDAKRAVRQSACAINPIPMRGGPGDAPRAAGLPSIRAAPGERPRGGRPRRRRGWRVST